MNKNKLVIINLILFFVFIVILLGATPGRSSYQGLRSGLTHEINIFSDNGEDNREPVSKSGDLRPVGFIVNVARPDDEGSAFIFKVHGSPGRCRILTSYHVAFPRSTPSPDTSKTGRSIFYIGKTESAGAQFADRAEATPVAWGDYEANRLPAEDWAVLSIKPCLEEKYGSLVLEPMFLQQAVAMQGKMNAAGFPVDLGPKDNWQHIFETKGCSIRGEFGDRAWRHDCSTKPAQSGGPIYYRDGTASIHVVALVHGAHGPTNGVLTT